MRVRGCGWAVGGEERWGVVVEVERLRFRSMVGGESGMCGNKFGVLVEVTGDWWRAWSAGEVCWSSRWVEKDGN